jgi:hypothetical protein
MCLLMFSIGLLLTLSATRLMDENADLREKLESEFAKVEDFDYWITKNGVCAQRHLRKEMEIAAAKNCELNKVFLQASK